MLTVLLLLKLCLNFPKIHEPKFLFKGILSVMGKYDVRECTFKPYFVPFIITPFHYYYLNRIITLYEISVITFSDLVYFSLYL